MYIYIQREYAIFVSTCYYGSTQFETKSFVGLWQTPMVLLLTERNKVHHVGMGKEASLHLFHPTVSSTLLKLEVIFLEKLYLRAQSLLCSEADRLKGATKLLTGE